MITPAEIRAKAARLYPRVVSAWLEGEEIFPYAMRANLRPSRTFSEALREQQALREGAKERLGYGYSLVLESRNSRRHGEQNFADSIFFETRDDLLKLVGKTQEFRKLSRAVDVVRQHQPQLEQWMRRHWPKLLAVDASLPQLLAVVEYLQAHPRPNCFVRELPLAISTKLVEENSKLLGQWLDILMPEAVDVTYGYDQFTLRYGFRAPDDQLLFRILDPDMLGELQCPGTEMALPLTTLAELPVHDARVIIVENKLNLLTLPQLPRAVALGGLGNGVSRLFRIPWIEASPLLYWGDIDVKGLQILAQVRGVWPHATSVLMDYEALQQYQELSIQGTKYALDLAPPDGLTPAEQTAFLMCRDQCMRMEQERIPQHIVRDCLTSAIAALPTLRR